MQSMPSAEILRSVLNAGKHAINASTRKHAIGAKQGKTCNWRQHAKHAIGAKRGKSYQLSYTELSLDAKEKKKQLVFLVSAVFRKCCNLD